MLEKIVEAESKITIWDTNYCLYALCMELTIEKVGKSILLRQSVLKAYIRVVLLYQKGINKAAYNSKTNPSTTSKDHRLNANIS